MRALLYPEFEQLRLDDVPVQRPAAGEVQLAVAACGICGSELEAFKTHSPRRPPPLVMGHEFCGTVVDAGAGDSPWREGMRVICNALIPCGACVRCRRGDMHLCATRQIFGMNRPGAFAERVNVPARCLIKWPESLPAAAAAMAEPAGNGVHVANLTRPFTARTALVLGAGPIGLFCQQMLQVLRGADVIVADLSAERRAVAERLGAIRTVDPRSEDLARIAMSMTAGEGVDVAVDAAGAAVTKQLSLASTRPGGAIVWIGLHENQMSLDSFQVTLPERHITGSYAATMDDLSLAVDLMARGKIDATSWTQIFPLEDGVTAFHRMLAAKGNDIKAVLVP